MTQASPALLARIDRLIGCQGHWVLIRDGEPETDCSRQWHQSPDEHLAECLRQRWRGLSLGFVPTYCGYSDYSTSAYARRESALSAEELAAVSADGALIDLMSYLPPMPTEDHLRVQVEMFNASMNGEDFDLDAWGAYYKPWSAKQSDADSASDSGQLVKQPASQPESAAVVPTAGKTSAADALLSQIRNRKA